MSKFARIPLVKGIDQSVDKRLLPEGGIYSIQNYYHNKTGRLAKREAMAEKSYTGFSTGIQNVRVAPGGSVTIEYGTSGQIFSYIPTADTFQTMGRRVHTVGNPEQYTFDVDDAGKTAIGGCEAFTAVVWKNTASNVTYLAVLDPTTGAVLKAPTAFIAYPANKIHITRISSTQVAITADSGAGTALILLWVISGPNYDVSTTTATLVTDRASTSGHDAYFDSGTRLVVAYINTSGDVSLSYHTATTGALDLLTAATPTGTASNVSVVSDSPRTWVAYDDATAGASVLYHIRNPDTWTSPAVIDANGVTPYLNIEDFLCYAIWNQNSGGGNSFQGIVHGAISTTPAVSGATTVRWGHLLRCPAFKVGGRRMTWTKNPQEGDTQAQLVLMDITDLSTDEPFPVARVGWQTLNSNFTGRSHYLDGYIWISNPIRPTGSADQGARAVPAAWKIAISNRHSRTIQNLGDMQISTGSLPCQLDGRFNPETGFLHYPYVFSSSVGTNGSLAARTYAYRMTYEAYSRGRRYQSSPSLQSTIYSTGSVTLNLVACHPSRRSRDVRVVVWRNATLGGNVFYRCGHTDIVASFAGTTVTFFDNDADATISTRETLYTSQERQPWVLPPCSAISTVNEERLWVADGTRLRYSNVLGGVVRDDGVTFYDTAYVPLSDAPIALGAMDGAVVALCAQSIFVVGGEGPQETDAGDFNRPWRLQTTIGCSAAYGGQRSVALTPKGLVYRSPFGIALLQYGWQVKHISTEVDDELVAYPFVQDVIVDVERGLVKFYCSATDATGSSCRILVWNYEESDRTESLIWTYYTTYKGSHCASQSGTTTIMGTEDGSDSRLYLERAASSGDYDHDDGTVHIQGAFMMGPFYPGGVGGFGRVKSVLVEGEYRGTCYVQANIRYDGNLDTSAAPTSMIYYTSSDTLKAGTMLSVNYRLARQRCNSLVLQMVEDNAVGTSNPKTEGVAFNSLSIEYEPLPGHRRLASARRK